MIFPVYLRYDERIDRVETRITARLRDQLGTARNANEMFRIFSRFNALFVRPHIRGAIREYQTQLIQRVKDDIESLHEKFKVKTTCGCWLSLNCFIKFSFLYTRYFSFSNVTVEKNKILVCRPSFLPSLVDSGER